MDGNISQNEIDSILASLTGEKDGGTAPSTTSTKIEPKKETKQTKPSLDTENISLLSDVKMTFSVVLGENKLPIKDLINIGKGSIVELNKFAGEDVDIYINDQMIGKGVIVAIDDEYAVKITKIINPIRKA